MRNTSSSERFKFVFVFLLGLVLSTSVLGCNSFSSSLSSVLQEEEEVPTSPDPDEDDSSTPTPTPTPTPDPDDNGAEPLTLNWSTPPTVNNFSDIGDYAYFSKDISYGPHARHLVDILLPKAAYDTLTPTSLVLYIHSGGFTQGSKESAYQKSSLIKTLLQNGVAVATINYPFIGTAGSRGVIDSLEGARRGLQFLRYYHKSFNFTRTQVALSGSSAGATSSLWLGTHDDMANISSSDPIERESTRVLGIAAVETQATLDAVEWEDIFKEYTSPAITINHSRLRGNVRAIYGMSISADVETIRSDAALIAYRNKVNILAHMDASDPEVWVESDEKTDTAPPEDSNFTSHLFHHPNHPAALKTKAEDVGMAGTFSIPQKGIVVPNLEPMEAFLFRKLGIP